ncbi:MAG TPA: hypothetical protein VK794_00415 [Steroidobacteraceae bacterium]|jgi:hypothetical protein|nr:hypothetical protein [Steroidobacteraceae bacterium]
MEIRRVLTAAVSVAALLFFFAPSAAFASSQTITFGALPAGPVPAGYSGFDWGTGPNRAIYSGPDAAIYYLTSPAASIVQFGRAGLFDLNSVDYQVLVSGETGLGSFDNYTTVVSGYQGTTLVKSVTENYPGTGGNAFNGLNIDGVNKVTFSTSDTFGFLDSMGQMVVSGTSAAATFVDKLTVSSSMVAPEIDPTSALSALTLLLGSLVVLRGRRAV